MTFTVTDEQDINEAEYLKNQAYNLYENQGLRMVVVAEELEISATRCSELVRLKRLEVDIAKRGEQRNALMVMERKRLPKKVVVEHGIVFSPPDIEQPMQEHGTFLGSQEGQETLERISQRYVPEVPEFLRLHSPQSPERELLGYGGAYG